MDQLSKNEKFMIYRDKLEKIVNEQDYVSYSEDSEEFKEDIIEVEDEDELKEQQFYKRSLKF